MRALSFLVGIVVLLGGIFAEDDMLALGLIFVGVVMTMTPLGLAWGDLSRRREQARSEIPAWKKNEWGSQDEFWRRDD
jgi:hypothetical protein